MSEPIFLTLNGVYERIRSTATQEDKEAAPEFFSASLYTWLYACVERALRAAGGENVWRFDDFTRRIIEYEKIKKAALDFVEKRSQRKIPLAHKNAEVIATIHGVNVGALKDEVANIDALARRSKKIEKDRDIEKRKVSLQASARTGHWPEDEK